MTYAFSRPDDISIANWRLSPFNRWSFQHVRELVPTARIRIAQGAAGGKDPWSTRKGGISVPLSAGQTVPLEKFLTETETNGLVVLSGGKTVLTWHAPECDPTEPHLLFSVSKSITGLLAGILQGRGLLNAEDRVTTYLPELAGSAYGDDCTVRHLLDMTVSLDFVEDYLDPESAFARYRRAMLWNPVDMTQDMLNLVSFAQTLQRLPHPHGERFFYASPTSDVLGAVVQRAGGKPFAELVSELLWQKIGASTEAYVTVDPQGNPRSAGGICVTTDDLAKVGEMVRMKGRAGNEQVVPEGWISDLWTGGSREAWLKGGEHLLSDGRYRSQWYEVGDANKCLCAIGIHGQWIYIDPKNGVVIAKTSAQALPVDDGIDRDCLAAFASLATQFAAG